VGKYGDDLEANLGALFKPTRSDAEKFETAVDLAMKIGEEIPVLGLAVRLVAWREAWFADGKKSERVTPVLLGLYERLSKLEAKQEEYLRSEDAQAVLEDAFARIADQPDETKREDLRRVLFKILEAPRDPSENRLFVRLADELPIPALKLLGVTHRPVNPMVSTVQGLGEQKEVENDDAKFWLNYLVGQGLVDGEQIGVVHHGTYESVLTPLGRLFEVYRRG
jgi:hypothetical protein